MDVPLEEGTFKKRSLTDGDRSKVTEGARQERAHHRGGGFNNAGSATVLWNCTTDFDSSLSCFQEFLFILLLARLDGE